MTRKRCPCLPRQQESSKNRLHSLGLAGLVLVDGLTCVLMRILQNASAGKGSVFSTGVADIIVMNVVRLALVLLLGSLGYWSWHSAQRQMHQVEGCAEGHDDVRLHRLGGSLLSVASDDTEASTGSVMFSTEQLDEEKRRVERSKRGDRRRDNAGWAMFAVCSLSAVYSGVKCVAFGNHNAFEGSGSALTALIGLGVFICHAEFYLASKCLVNLTTVDGLSFPWLHMHPLHFVAKADARTCQTCRTRIQQSNHDGMAYYCDICVYHYYCIACLKRQLRQRQPSIGNGDVNLQEAGQQERSAFVYVKRVLPLVRPFVHIVVLSFLMVCVNQAFNLMMPHWQGVIMDAVAKSNAEVFQHAIIMYLVINIGNGFFSSVQSSSVLLVTRKLAYRTRLTVFQHILRQDIAYFDANLAGQITSRLTSDTQQMTDPVSILMNNLLSNIIRLAGGLFMCFRTSWKLSILAMVAIFPTAYLVKTYSDWAGKIQRTIQDELSEANGVATQAIQNMRTVRYFGAETHELNRYETNLQNVYALQMKDSFTRIAKNMFTNYMDLGVGVFVLWYGGWVIIEGEQKNFSLGQLISFQLYWNMMKNSFDGLNSVLSSLSRATAASQRILDLLDLKPTIETGHGQGLSIDNTEPFGGLICIDHVTFHYVQKRSNKPVINDLYLEILGGQVTAIVGKSGSGKSTVASLLLRLYDPIDGRITLDGRDFRDLKPQALRAQFGVVAQETQLFAGTIEDNIAYATLKPHTRQDLELAAAKANILEFVQKCDDGFQTLVGDRGVLLSGGQKQRIAIARMFLRRPKLLLLDEATSALDAENEAIVQEALDGLVESGVCRTVMVIAHRLSTVRHADQIAVMEDGELMELGKHEELLKTGGIYAQLVGRQLSSAAKDAADAEETARG